MKVRDGRAAARSGEMAPWETDLVAQGMAKWRRERPDIDCSGKAVVGRILHLQERILRAVNQALARHGLRYPTYAVLVTLRVQGPPYQLSPSALAETLLLTSGGLSNLLRRIEAEGLIRRMADALDGRAVIVELTDLGFALADAAMADHAEVERALTDMLPDDEREAMIRGLSRIITSR